MALSSELRSTLEKAIVAARDAAEEASRAALGILAVDADRAPDAFNEQKRRARVALRAEARQLGGFERLVEECAYEQWHRMLFARFLAENDLLIHPEHGVPVTLDDCEEIAHARGESDLWLVASEFASTMLPGIFRSDDPVLQVTLAPEGQQRLEETLAGLPREIFTSEDGLGWVYQYWQAKKKKEVNASERKIGGADIAPVTQLFTENYMVRFLLENTLGAWWAARNPESPLVKEWEYLRLDEEGPPAAGGFPGWPETVAEVTVMDPCCGSGHFLVVAFEMLRRMRMEAEGLSAAEAGVAVLRDNLFGLELDPRCTQIAAFALALQAWKTGGYRKLPIPNIACSGISAKGRLEDWKKLARGNERLERSLERLHALFADAGDLGSLIDPLRETDGQLLVAQFEEVAPLLEQALDKEAAVDPSAAVFGNAAAGAVRASQLLARRYVLVTTNPPFLGRGKQGDVIRAFTEARYPRSRQDLATAFLERGRSLASSDAGVAFVTPENWFIQTSYRELREDFLANQRLRLAAILGEEGFRAFGNRGPRAALVVIENGPDSDGCLNLSLDVSTPPGRDQIPIAEKIRRLKTDPLAVTKQRDHLRRPGARILFGAAVSQVTLRSVAESFQGIKTGDDSRFRRVFWEFEAVSAPWRYAQGGSLVEGRSGLHYAVNLDEPLARLQGMGAWSRQGLAVGLTRHLPTSRYLGLPFFSEIAAVVPVEEESLPALLEFGGSGALRRAVRQIDRGTIITNATLLDVPIDALPAGGGASTSLETKHPYQWAFHGHVARSSDPLNVAVARLAGYRWPRQTGSEFPECPALGPDGLEPLADEDGIVCIQSIRGERPAAERLRALLAAAFGEEWSPAKEADLLAEIGYAGKSLEQWLRDGFFEQHCQLFHQRPFVWQIWDGRKDGFSALANYHRLDRANLEKLVYTYLGEWTRQQREAATAGTPGADLRLAAAEELKGKLELILEGEDPYDIFVRWKPLAEQPIGWEPDLNDGARLNIRPCITAGVLRKNPKLKWGKDRGKDPESAPWYPVFKGDRINDYHLTLAEKRAAREAAERRAAAS